MYVRRLSVSQFMGGRLIGMLLAMIWRVIFTGIIKCAQKLIKIDN